MSDLTLVDPAQAGAVCELADIHAAAFDRPWDEAALATLLGQTGVFAVSADAGFILCRVVVDEAEILTLAVRPAARQAGLGVRLTTAAADFAAKAGADRLFLEVAETNIAARALYARAGFKSEGRRKGYYAGPDGARTDALLLVLNLLDRLPTT